MFRKNKTHQQPSFFDSDRLLPPKARQRLEQSWARVFREEVFMRIPEEVFAVLFSDKDSRPNAPVNVLVGGDMLKSGFGWSDEELEEHLQFDLLTRYALGLDNLSQIAPTVRTFQNLRRRVREHAEEHEENLYEEVFAVVTDQQIAKLGLKVSWQRMDSTQMLSNIAQSSRLELLVAVLQKGVQGLSPTAQARWQADHAAYLSKRPRHVGYGLTAEEVTEHLEQLGHLLVALLADLAQESETEAAQELVGRVLGEQYILDDEQLVRLRMGEEIGANTLQSPHDPEATYRRKHEQGYRGYVTNLSETCDPENPVQLITDVQTAPNQADDSQLMDQSLASQSARGHQIKKVTVDGGYTGPQGEAACDQHQVELHPSRVRGGKAKADRWGWDEYEWQVDDDQDTQTVTCPQGQTVPLKPTGTQGRLIARFDEETCRTCPFFQQACRTEPRKRKPPTLPVTQRNIEVAQLRQRINRANNGIRAAVEATVRSYKKPFPGGKLPVRGLIRSHMVSLGSALIVNMRRLHRHFQDKAETGPETTTAPGLIGHFSRLFGLFASRWPTLSLFRDHGGGQPTGRLHNLAFAAHLGPHVVNFKPQYV